MTLDERMAFRREMVFESVREVMLTHGVLSTDYRLNVARLDARGHVYAAMVDLKVGVAGRSLDSPGELLSMEAAIEHVAKSRYRVKVSAVYWRMDSTRDGRRPVEAEVDSRAMSMAPVSGDDSLQPRMEGRPQPTADRQSIFSRKGNVPVDDFPDTLVEDRSVQLERVSAEELAEFARAIEQVQGVQHQSVKVGSRTYETDFASLD
jgi:hypothetical protein